MERAGAEKPPTENIRNTMYPTRRQVLRTGGVALAGSIVGSSVVGGEPGSNRTAILNHEDAEAANGVPTTAKANTRRGSWLSEGDDDDEALEDKFFLWIDPKEQPYNLGQFTIADIDHISYWTNKPTPASEPDFYLSIYTEPDEQNDDASWYGHRLNGEPIYARNRDGPANQWNQWHARSGFTGNETNELGFSDSHHSPVGFFGAPTLSDLQAGPIDWSSYHQKGDSTSIDYASESVKSLVLATGTPWSDEFNGYIDTIEIAVNTGPGNSGKGQSLLVDLEPGSGGKGT